MKFITKLKNSFMHTIAHNFIFWFIAPQFKRCELDKLQNEMFSIKSWK